MTKKFFTFLVFPLFFIAVAFITGCYHPIGGLLTDNTGNYIMADPIRFLYKVNDDPFKVDHVYRLIYVFERGEKYIDVRNNEVYIGIIENLLNSDALSVQVGKDEEYKFQSKGVKKVVISYLDMKTSYKIEVVAPEDFPEYKGDGGISIIPVWPK